MNPFAELGLPEHFAIERAALDARYRELQKVFHPDKSTTLSPTERRLRSARALTLSQAYRVLGDPVARAEALLNLHAAHSEVTPSAEFLMAMMEEREALAEHIGDRAWLERKARNVTHGLAKLEDELGHCFVASDHAAAAQKLAEMKYWSRIREAIQVALDDIQTAT